MSHWFSKKRGIAVAIIASGNYLSGVIWSPFIANSLTVGGWRDIYLFIALAISLVVIPMAFFLPEKRKEIQRPAAKLESHLYAKKIAISGRQLHFFWG